MSVIIRLQNLPWSANALDIRQFFRGLSIPEGGVHIVGGEMGDAFIAFSTDEDARQAMMHDREAINGVQIRLLLSSRAEMQKVIEIARQQSLLALKKAAALQPPKASPPPAVAINVQKTMVATATAPIAVPQPPVITANSFKNILTNPMGAAATPSFMAYQQQAGFTLIPEANSNTSGSSSVKNHNDKDSDDSESRHSPRERRRSDSREHRRSRSRSRERSIFRRRREHSRDRSRERDWINGGRRTSRHRSRSRERSRERGRGRSRERSRDRSRERSRNNNRDSLRHTSRDGANNNRSDNKPKTGLSPWNITNAYQAGYSTTETPTGQSGLTNKSMDSMNTIAAGVSVTAVATTFQNYNTGNQSLTALNNYSLSGILSAGNSSDSYKFALQNPYTTAQNSSETSTTNNNNTSSSAIPGIYVEKKSDEPILPVASMDAVNSLAQEPIAFANVNPYEQMYPNLFAQAAALSSGQKAGTGKQNTPTMPTDSPKAEEPKPKESDLSETCCIKISNMCPRTTYSDLRKFFVGLFIPHNGIKMLNDKHGLRIGIAYVQFSRQSSVPKALCRNNNQFKGKSVIIEAVSEQEFLEAEDSYRPPNQDKPYGHGGNDNGDDNNESGNNNNNSGFSALNPYKKMIQLDPFTVLYIEDIPALATEQDIMKMFSSYSLYDILLIASPENRREFVAHVRFSREEDAKAAYEDRAHHQIGYRRVRVRPGSIEEMEKVKEKIRLANEQLMKEEKAAEEEETKRKLEKLIEEHIEEEENKQKLQENIESMDLTQEDGEGDSDDDDDVVETTNELQNNKVEVSENKAANVNNFDARSNDSFSNIQNKFISNVDPRRPQTPQIPSLLDVDTANNVNTLRPQNRSQLFNDPRLRNLTERAAAFASTNNLDNNNRNSPTIAMGNNNFNNFNPNFNPQQLNSPPNLAVNSMENNFIILKNCDYNTRINDVAQLLLTANLALKHIEPLRNERQLPTGEFIVEFRRNNDAEIAVKRFHNIQFRNRNLRVFPITPQEIADRLGKPFLNYIPGGNGIRMNKNDIVTRNNMNITNNPMNSNNNNGNNNNNNRFANFRANNNNPFSDNGGAMNNPDTGSNNRNNNNMPNNNGGNGNNGANNSGPNNNGGSGIPDKFNRPDCVLALENVPYKATLSDILYFFQGFDLTPDDIIRRFNDDGSPTGDARVAFKTPEDTRSAFETRKRKKMFGRCLYLRKL